MRVDTLRWPSSRGFINSCNEYVSKSGKKVQILRYPQDNGSLIKRIDKNKEGIIERIMTFVTANGKTKKTIDKQI